MPRKAPIWLGIAVIGAAGCGGGGTLSKKDLQTQAEAVQSFAAEGALVAQDTENDRTTEIFVRVHTEYLAKGARKVETELTSAHATGSLERKREEAANLASVVSENLDRLHRDPGDEALAGRLKRAFEENAAAAEKLAK